MAIVVESNILGNRIKVHTIIEEKEGDRPEKLSSEAEIYTKEQIRRLGNKKNSDFIDDEIDSSLLNEIKSLLQD